MQWNQLLRPSPCGRYTHLIREFLSDLRTTCVGFADLSRHLWQERREQRRKEEGGKQVLGRRIILQAGVHNLWVLHTVPASECGVKFLLLPISILLSRSPFSAFLSQQLAFEWKLYLLFMRKDPKGSMSYPDPSHLQFLLFSSLCLRLSAPAEQILSCQAAFLRWQVCSHSRTQQEMCGGAE